ncbi:MAG: MBL fold metallo-hydrolase [Terracidiphilus sp.]|jgi:glyoxylase-like metal-dependent hydrolase (beta-lactamase superfamily II)
MRKAMNRRNFLQLGLTAGAAAILPFAANAQAEKPENKPADKPSDKAAQPHAEAAVTPIKTTQLTDNVFLLQGEGGNMALQTGPDGNILIDASYATAVPRILESIAPLSKVPADAPGILINTHWHNDHTGGNEGMYEAGYTIFAHQNVRQRLSTPQTMALFQRTIMPAMPGAWPTITFEHEMRIWHNGDSLDLVHFEPAHTDGDSFIHFKSPDILHVGDIWFNGMYPFIDEGAGGSIGGMIRAGEKVLSVASSGTRIIPGHGPLGSKADFNGFRNMLLAVREKVAALKAAGVSEEDAIARKPTTEFDAAWGKGFMNPDTFAGIVYRTL